MGTASSFTIELAAWAPFTWHGMLFVITMDAAVFCSS